MIKSKKFDFDIVSHFDLPKKFDKRAETHDLIMEKVVETLELAKKRDLAIEINSSGLRKKIREQYPSVEIIEKMYELDIPVLLGSDAHQIDEIAYEFKYIIDLLKNIGYNQLAHYNKRRRTFIEID
jgi:histidinol-phosphatase (PHP family)